MYASARIKIMAAGALMLASMFAAGQASAAVIPLTANMDGAQANAGAGTGSPGTGFATMTFDDVSNMLSWDISWSGLLGTETAMHFHGPAPAGVNAGVQVNIGAISGLVSPSIGSTTISAAQASDLLAGLWYINLHTTRDAGGEIRGQVLPEPGTLVLLGCAAGGVLLRRRVSR